MSAVLQSLPSTEEAALAKVSSRELSAYLETRAESQKVTITGNDGLAHQVEVPLSAMKLLVEVLTQLGEGNMVNLIPVHAELTTQEAADLLNMSRPTFIKLLDEGSIPYHRSGNRRKVKYMDAMHYKEVTDRKRVEALEELTRLDQDLGLGY